MLIQLRPTVSPVVGEPSVLRDKAPANSAQARHGGAADRDPEWSVIVIARNEAHRIGRCLDAVGQAMRHLQHEIIVVDSDSKDETVRIATRYPVTILRLSATQPLTPAAGRYVGTILARGEFLLFVDGDSVLDPEWIGHALEALRDSRIAGVAGAREMVLSSATDGRILARHIFAQDQAGSVDLPFLGGSAVYRASALRKAGGFNPHLYACEEAELGARLSKQGYTLRRLPVRMTEHLTESRGETYGELVRRCRRGYPIGMGQLVRYGIANGTLTEEHITAILRPVGSVLMLLLGFAGVGAALLLGRPGPLLIWISAATVAGLIFSYRTRGVRRPLYYVCEWIVTGAMILRGIFMRPRPAEAYVPSLTVVRPEASSES